MKTCAFLLTGLASVATTEAFFSSPVHNNASMRSTPSALQSATIPDNDTFHDDSEPDSPLEKDLPKFSQSLPFLARPKELKQEFAGDVGFDPLNFAKNRDLLLEYREAEIKHSRLAMLAALGWPMSELYDIKIATILQTDAILDATDRVPSLFDGGMEKVNPVWWGFCLGLTAAIDLYGVNRARSGVEGYTPGDLGWDPMGLYPANKKDQMDMQLAEVKHGRLAMIAITGFSVQEVVTGIGIVDETPLFFKPLEILEEVLGDVIEDVIDLV